MLILCCSLRDGGRAQAFFSVAVVVSCSQSGDVSSQWSCTLFLLSSFVSFWPLFYFFLSCFSCPFLSHLLRLSPDFKQMLYSSVDMMSHTQPSGFHEQKKTTEETSLGFPHFLLLSWCFQALNLFVLLQHSLSLIFTVFSLSLLCLPSPGTVL